jgi:hypothetical protein
MQLAFDECVSLDMFYVCGESCGKTRGKQLALVRVDFLTGRHGSDY